MRSGIAVALAAAWASAAMSFAGQALAEKEIQEAIRELGSDDYQKRHAASQRLIDAGPDVRPALMAAAETTKDPEIRARIASIRKDIVGRHPEKALKISIELPGKALAVSKGGTPDGKPWLALDAKVWFENASDMPIVVRRPVLGGRLDELIDPFYRFELRDSGGKVVPCTFRGNLDAAIVMAYESDFVLLRPGDKADVFHNSECPNKSFGEVRAYLDDEIPQGKYSLAVTYNMNRHAESRPPMLIDEPKKSALSEQLLLCRIASAPAEVQIAQPGKDAAK